jgi:competence protein ComEA
MKLTSVIALSLFIVTHTLHAVSVNTNSPKPADIKAVVQSEKINLNKADVTTLTHSFKGIGKKRAEAIVQYRQIHHEFKTLEELGNVKGFSPNFINKNKERLEALFSLS